MDISMERALGLLERIIKIIQRKRHPENPQPQVSPDDVLVAWFRPLSLFPLGTGLLYWQWLGYAASRLPLGPLGRPRPPDRSPWQLLVSAPGYPPNASLVLAYTEQLSVPRFDAEVFMPWQDESGGSSLKPAKVISKISLQVDLDSVGRISATSPGLLTKSEIVERIRRGISHPKSGLQSVLGDYSLNQLAGLIAADSRVAQSIEQRLREYLDSTGVLVTFEGGRLDPLYRSPIPGKYPLDQQEARTGGQQLSVVVKSAEVLADGEKRRISLVVEIRPLGEPAIPPLWNPPPWHHYELKNLDTGEIFSCGSGEDVGGILRDPDC